MQQGQGGGSKRFQQRVQYAILLTSVWPLLNLYKGLYALAVRHIQRGLRCLPGLQSLYLTGGCARNQVYPGLSDIDMLLLVEEQRLPQAQAVRRRYERLWPMFRNGCFVCSPRYFQQFFLESWTEQCLCEERRGTGRRLAGREVLRETSLLSSANLQAGYYVELHYWWSVFAEYALPLPTSRWEEVWGRSICYKTIADVARYYHAYQTGHFPFKRREGLEATGHVLGSTGQALAERVLLQERHRFLRPDPTLCDDTLRFLVSFLHTLHTEELPALPALCPQRALSQRVDICPEEVRLSATERHALESLVETARLTWGEKYQGAAWMPCAWHRMEDLVLLLHATPEALPTRAELAAVIAQAQVLLPNLRRTIHLYLHLPNLALRFYCYQMEQQRRHALLSRFLFPDALMQLGQEGYSLDGPPLSPLSPCWNRWQEAYLLNWRHHRSWDYAALLLEPNHRPKTTADFVQGWWKALQLLAIERSIQRGEVIYPLTLPAVRRALVREGVPLPLSLLPLEEAFYRELRGEPTDLSNLLPEASEFLGAVNAQAQEADVTQCVRDTERPCLNVLRTSVLPDAPPSNGVPSAGRLAARLPDGSFTARSEEGA